MHTNVECYNGNCYSDTYSAQTGSAGAYVDVGGAGSSAYVDVNGGSAGAHVGVGILGGHAAAGGSTVVNVNAGGAGIYMQVDDDMDHYHHGGYDEYTYYEDVPQYRERYSAGLGHDGLNSLLYSLKQASFESDRMNIIRDVCRSAFFTSDEVYQVVDALSFDDEKVNAAIMMYPRTVDAQNFHVVYDAINFSSSREKVANAIMHTEPVMNYREPSRGSRRGYGGRHQVSAMQSYDFSSLLNSLDNESFDSNRLSMIEQSARTSAFTSNQVRQLVETLSFDDSRVKAAISLYQSTVDARNWHVVYDAFSFSSSKSKVSDAIQGMQPLGH